MGISGIQFVLLVLSIIICVDWVHSTTTTTRGEHHVGVLIPPSNYNYRNNQDNNSGLESHNGSSPPPLREKNSLLESGTSHLFSGRKLWSFLFYNALIPLFIMVVPNILLKSLLAFILYSLARRFLHSLYHFPGVTVTFHSSDSDGWAPPFSSNSRARLEPKVDMLTQKILPALYTTEKKL